jgi:hypothetical protein
VWSWFVPIYTYFKPAILAKEIWNKNESQLNQISGETIKKKSYIIIAWWAFWVSAIILSNFGSPKFHISSFQLFGQEQMLKLQFIGQLLFIFAGIFAIIVILNFNKTERTIITHDDKKDLEQL